MLNLFKRPANWCSIQGISHYQIPPQLKEFLLSSASTTQRMEREYNSQTIVDLFKQGWFPPHYHEAQILEVGSRKNALLRETYLHCQNKLWMFARAVFPPYFFTGINSRILAELDTRPLGKILFRDATLRRSEFEICQLSPQHIEYQWAMQNCNVDEKLWARRSLFYLHNKPLLLTEIFLPGFFELVKKI